MAKPDLNKGVYIKLDGEIGHYHTIPIDKLVEISQKFQALINGIAKLTVDHTALKMENFQIELCDLKKNSVAPGYVFTPRQQPVLTGNYEEQRKNVNEQFTKFLNIANKGDYSELKKLYKDPEARNTMVPLVYDFVGSFGNTPVQIGSYTKNKFVGSRKIGKFKPEVYSKLVGKNPKKEKPKQQLLELAAIVEFNVATKKTRLKKYFENEQNSLSYSLYSFVENGMTKHFNFPLTVPVHFDDEKNYILECKQLNIYAFGKTMEAAQNDFNSDFDHLFTMVFNTPDNKLGRDMLNAKRFLHLLISK